ncbi:para-aminobenzoate synthetase / 4-amino-4-deoxychorismate lyase [Polaromonas sp. OV174]|uniref:aminodeoxychorismate synthase component I n=1 Tax=Polaromonas sp. OV174 TaxID=1855300 RepID=UPI0008E9234F|nr:aminodeoxychorismate synthase component I [Polaromonas sp. OV174]SFB68554.1 para-aminobenzoate synthetase / 4-amino-4-deoxychorismate lyase [Polaromonas sp. OV174]
MTITSLIDFVDPHDSAAPRLRQAFGAPRELLVAHQLHEVRAVLDAVQAAAEQGAWVLGALRYEAAPAFDAALQTRPADGPLAWFAVYDEAMPWPETSEPPPEPTLHWQSRQERAQFDAAFAAIQQAIARGEFYQVNYTAQLQATLEGGGAAPARALFAALQRAQPGGYAAYIDMGDEQLLSVSPELFFDWRGASLLTRPMKGTAPRGATPAQDAAQAEWLRSSPKERAENVMIVDLLRNDVSRIAQPFSVQVPALFHTQALPAVWQMTSDVQARTRAGCSLAEVFAALFPCGSITGAPKVRAMQAIRALEAEPRGIYCGAIGVMRPGGAATFNVPIRTVTLRGREARCGIGSGITSGAEADSEWQEWRHKRAFLERASMPFELLETLALQDGQLRHVSAHLQRMAGAAAHFGYRWDEAQARQCLEQLAQTHPQGLWRLRLLLGAAGQFGAQAYAMEASASEVLLRLAGHPLLEAHGEFVRFKTTRRAHYEAFTPSAPEVFDTVLWNERGEITECTRGNVAMLIDGRWVTPSLACGLLAGVGRALALQEGRLSEAVVRVEDVPRVQGWAFVNSLRGWIAARLV